MNRCKLLSVCLTTFLLCGCGPVFSLFPLYHDKDVVEHDQILGRWEGVDISKSKEGSVQSRTCCWEFTKLEKQEYRVSIPTDQKFHILSGAHFLVLDKNLFIDIQPLDDDASNRDVDLFPAVPAHLFGRVWFEQGQVQIKLLGNDWCRDALLQKRIHLDFAYLDSALVLTANTEDLQEFATKYASDEDAFSDEYTLVRPKN